MISILSKISILLRHVLLCHRLRDSEVETDKFNRNFDINIWRENSPSIGIPIDLFSGSFGQRSQSFNRSAEQNI